MGQVTKSKPEFNSRSGNKRSMPKRNGRYGNAGQKDEFSSRGPSSDRRNPCYSHGIMRD